MRAPALFSSLRKFSLEPYIPAWYEVNVGKKATKKPGNKAIGVITLGLMSLVDNQQFDLLCREQTTAEIISHNLR